MCQALQPNDLDGQANEFSMTIPCATIPREIVECIAHGREPSVQELGRVARTIWRDIHGGDSGGLDLSASPAARHLSFRAAHAALAGGS